MERTTDIHEGMAVYGTGDRLLGRVERLHGDGFHVAGQHYGRDQVDRITGEALYLRDTAATAEAAGAATDMAEGEIRVPVVEERLKVGKREAQLGEVDIHKTVTEEEQTASVTLRHDEVNVREVDIAERPLRPEDDAFNEGTIRVQLRGEEAVVAKETVVTGEVVIDKETVAHEEQVSGTVRRQHVDVDEQYREARTDLEREHGTRAGATGRAFAEAEPNYRTGFDAGHDERYAEREFADVEPELQRDHATRGVTADRWAELRHEIEAGWNKARNR